MGVAKWKKAMPPAERQDLKSRWKTMSKEERKVIRKKYTKIAKENRKKAAAMSPKKRKDIPANWGTMSIRERAKYTVMMRDKGKKSKGGCARRCTFIPHPQVLMASICAVCGRDKPSIKSIVWYNRNRRHYKATMKLSSLVVPVMAEDIIVEISEAHGIISNTSASYVTLMEGLVPPATNDETEARCNLVESLRATLRRNPWFRIRGLSSIPTQRSKDHMLVVVDLEHPSEEVQHEMKRLLSCCVLPQWPLHCALGITERANAKKLCRMDSSLLQSLRAVDIRVNVDDLQELAPPPLKPSGCNGPCTYVPHPTRLMTSVCGVCGYERPSVNSVLWYNKKRRLYKSALGLSSLIAPVDAEEALFNLYETYGITSNTASIHVTLVEGLMPSSANQNVEIQSHRLERLRAALQLAPTFRVRGLSSIPTFRSDQQSLVMLQLEPSSEAVQQEMNHLTSCCALPQWPLHCTLGTTDTRNAELLCREDSALYQRLMGSEIRVNADYLHELNPPPLEENAHAATMTKILPNLVNSLQGRELEASIARLNLSV